MITINKNMQSEILMTTMEELVPEDSLFRKIDKYIDFTFIYDEVRDLYCENNGRPSIDPVVLFKLVKNKNYFVITTNVDGQFLKAGFNHNKVFEVQGSLSKIQCAVGCHNKLYDDLKMVRNMLKENNNCTIPTKLVPICPVCKGKTEVNLRKDAFFVEDDNWHKLNHNYEQFVNDNKDKKLILIELGVGFNTPSIIRFPFERMVLEYKDTTLIRVNNKYSDLAFEIEDKTILINDDCNSFIKKIL